MKGEGGSARFCFSACGWGREKGKSWGGGWRPSFPFTFNTLMGMNTLIHTGLLMLLLSSSPALCQWLPPPFLCSSINLSSQPTLPSPWNCNRSGWSSNGGLGAVTRLCVTRAGCYISGISAPLTQARLYLHTPTCAPTHTAFLLSSSEPLHEAEWSRTHL